MWDGIPGNDLQYHGISSGLLHAGCGWTEPSGRKVVEVDNVMSLSYSCLRQWILPSLLRVEAHRAEHFILTVSLRSERWRFPMTMPTSGSHTLTMLGAVIAHAEANFSEIHSCLDLLLYYLDRPLHAGAAGPSFVSWKAGGENCVPRIDSRVARRGTSGGAGALAIGVPVVALEWRSIAAG